MALQFYFEKKPRTLQSTLIQLDTSQITSLRLYPSADQQAEYLLKKETDFWVVYKKEVTLKVEAQLATQFLKNLATIKTNKVAARDSADWAAFGIDRTQANRVKVFAGTHLLDEFFVHQLDKVDGANKNISFVRLTTGEEVYEVNGALSALFSRKFDAYRNTQLLSIQKNKIKNIKIATIPHQLTELSENNGFWTQDGLPVDSTTLANYLTGLQSVTSTNYIDDFDPFESKNLLFKTLTIEGTPLEKPIIIAVYLDSTRTYPYILQSNQNQGSFFASGEHGIFEQVFGGW